MNRPEWMAEAACRTTPTLLFFPDTENVSDRYKELIWRVCGDCTVYSQCLDWAIEKREIGLWAATDERERRRMRRRREVAS